METELKFQIPAAALAGVRRAVATASAERTPLVAIYFDTPTRQLAAAGLALRLRREGPRWVQTLKGRGDGLAVRLEHEVMLPPASGRARGEPALDPARHAGSEAGAALAAALDGAAALEAVFRTEVRRTHRRVRSGGAVIEIALDEGTLQAGPSSAPVREIEFELIAGPPAALPALAARWVRRHGLWWDVRTKAERGARLALGLEQVPPVKAAPSPVEPGSTPAAAFAAMVRATLAHALPNAAEIADGRGAAEHLHQLRVGLRRLRSVLREFGDWSGDGAAARALEADWRAPFAALGDARDLDVLAATLAPRLSAIGAPPLPARSPAPTAADPGAIVRSVEVQALLLRALALTLPGLPTEPTAPLAAAARRALRRAWKRALADREAFAQAPAEAQHRTRKRIKRLRYAFEFMLPLVPAKAGRRLQKALAAAGEALGALNDLYLASAAYEAQVASEPRAWFALGWLVAERQRAIDAAALRLRELERTPRPWRRG